jgi:hypothetical protein
MKRAKVITEADQAEMVASSPPTNYGYTDANPSFTYGANSAPVFNISTPLGTSDTIQEMIQSALQKLKRYGDSETFAGAV